VAQIGYMRKLAVLANFYSTTSRRLSNLEISLPGIVVFFVAALAVFCYAASVAISLAARDRS